MGSILSSRRKEEEEEEEGGGRGESSASRVMVVRSSADWTTQWDLQKKSDKLMVIDFKASWCGPCRAMEPALKALSAKFAQVTFIQIDVDELPQVSQQWEVEAMPTFVLLMGKVEVGRVVGAQKEELESRIVRCLRA